MATRNIEGVNYCIKSFDELGIDLDSFVRNIESTLPETDYNQSVPVSPRNAVAAMVAQNPEHFNDPDKSKDIEALTTPEQIEDYKNKNNLKLNVKLDAASEVLDALSRVANTQISGFDSELFKTDAKEILASCQLDTNFDSQRFETTPEEIVSACKELPQDIPPPPSELTQLVEPEQSPDQLTENGINQLNELADRFRPTEKNNECANKCGDAMSSLVQQLKEEQDEFITQLEDYSDVEQEYFYSEIVFEYIQGKYLTYKNIKGEFQEIEQRKFELKQRQAQGENVASQIQELDLQKESLNKSQLEFYSDDFGFQDQTPLNPFTTKIASVETLKQDFDGLKKSLEDDFSNRLKVIWDEFSFTFFVDTDSENLPSKGVYPRFYELVESLIPDDEEQLSEPDFVENFRTQEDNLRQSILISEFERQRKSFRAFGETEAKVLVRFSEIEGSQLNQFQDLGNQLVTVLDNLQNSYDVVKRRRDAAFEAYNNIRGRIEDSDAQVERVRNQMESLPCYDCQPEFDLSPDSQNRFDPDDISFPEPDEPDPTKLAYWQRFALNATTASVLNPLSWSVGLLVPTPAGVLKVPLPTIWLALAVIPMPFGIWVVFLGINGIIPSPFLYEINFITGGGSMFRFGLRGANETIKVLDIKDTDKVKTYTTSLAQPPRTNSCDGKSFFQSPQLSMSKLLIDLQKQQLSNPFQLLQNVIPIWSLLPPSFLNQETIRSFAINNEPEKNKIFIREDLPSWKRLPTGFPLLNPAFTRYVTGFVMASKNLGGLFTPPSPFPYL